MKKELFLILIICSMFSIILCANEPNLEWTDPISGTYFNFSSLKKNPQ